MKKYALLFALAIFCPLSQATTKLVMDKVVFQTSAKRWVSTQTALLTVTVNATLSNADLVKVRAEIMANLNKIAAGEWQITQFDRSQDTSGLEKLTVSAQTRVQQTGLQDIYQSAQKVSKPGSTYLVNTVEFKPSMEEIQQVKAQLREMLYQQINGELGRLNKAYPEQKYSVHEIAFYEGDQPTSPMAKMNQSRELKTMVLAASLPISVSNELILTAVAELASNRQSGASLANN